MLIGDAAHPMYPTGSNGGSQAIVDSRILGACLVEHGINEAALAAFDAKLWPISQVVLRNRGAGPFGLLNMVDERCAGTFDNIDDVILPAERTAFMAGYKAAAGFAIETLNNAPPTLVSGARVRTAATAKKSRSSPAACRLHNTLPWIASQWRTRLPCAATNRFSGVSMSKNQMLAMKP